METSVLEKLVALSRDFGQEDRGWSNSWRGQYQRPLE